MSQGKKVINHVFQKMVGIVSINDARVEELRQILEKEQGHHVTPEEAKEYGQSIITVYKVLAGDREILGVDRVKDGGHE